MGKVISLNSKQEYNHKLRRIRIREITISAIIIAATTLLAIIEVS